MKTSPLFTAFAASLGLLGCNRSASSPVASATANAPVSSMTATADSAAPNARPAASGRGAAAPGKSAAAPGANSYENRETYPHSVTGSVTTLIAGSGQSGGPPITPSSTLIAMRIEEWQLTAADVQAALDRGGPIVRTREDSRGAITSSQEEAALLTLVNNRFLADPFAVQISTHLEADAGQITLTGRVGSAGLLGRAIAIALSTKGVTKVISELTIDARLPGEFRYDLP